MASIGEQIIAARKARGMTQAALAEAVGLTRPGSANYESGRRLPDAETLLKLARVLDYSFEEGAGVQRPAHPEAPASRDGNEAPAQSAATDGYKAQAQPAATDGYKAPGPAGRRRRGGSRWAVWWRRWRWALRFSCRRSETGGACPPIPAR